MIFFITFIRKCIPLQRLDTLGCKEEIYKDVTKDVETSEKEIDEMYQSIKLLHRYIVYNV